MNLIDPGTRNIAGAAIKQYDRIIAAIDLGSQEGKADALVAKTGTNPAENAIIQIKMPKYSSGDGTRALMQLICDDQSNPLFGKEAVNYLRKYPDQAHDLVEHFKLILYPAYR